MKHNKAEQDLHWMKQAINLACFAEKHDEVPVGAVLIDDNTNTMLGLGYNRMISDNDPTAHAEIIALRNAGNYRKNYRLINTTLYVTLEPCLMCVGAMIHARISRLVFGACDKKTGAITSTFNLLDEINAGKLNHKINYDYGVLANDCGKLLTDFFHRKRLNPNLLK